MEIYSGYEEMYFENTNVVARTMNEIILESLIFGFMESNKIGIWSCIVHLKCYIEIHGLWDLWIEVKRTKELSPSNDYVIVQEP